MTPEHVFSIANLVALAGWILLVLVPGRRWVADVATAWVIPGLFALAYTPIVATQFFGGQGGFSSLAAVSTLFSNPWTLLAGWIHYLAFDLLIGTWEARDARQRGVPHLALVPCLALTFMFGPAGWLLYAIVRSRFTPA
jgi:hypothetical protein